MGHLDKNRKYGPRQLGKNVHNILCVQNCIWQCIWQCFI